MFTEGVEEGFFTSHTELSFVEAVRNQIFIKAQFRFSEKREEVSVREKVERTYTRNSEAILEFLFISLLVTAA